MVSLPNPPLSLPSIDRQDEAAEIGENQRLCFLFKHTLFYGTEMKRYLQKNYEVNVLSHNDNQVNISGTITVKLSPFSPSLMDRFTVVTNFQTRRGEQHQGQNCIFCSGTRTLVSSLLPEKHS